MEEVLRGQRVRRAALAGVRVADFSWVLGGPICTKYLALMGAEVIKVETRRRIDIFRMRARGADGQPLVNQGPSFNAINHSKLSCTLNLTKPEAVDIAKRLVGVSDVVIENFAFGVMDRLGLGYAVLRKINPAIIMLSSSGLGRTGPDREVVAYGNNLQAFTGLTGLIGYEGGRHRGIGTSWTDQLTGVTAAFAILAALHHRRRTGAGQFIDLSMTEATLAQLPEAILDYTMNGRVQRPMGNQHGTCAPHNCYPCIGHDKWVAITVQNNAEWRGLCQAMERPDLAEDERFADQYRRWLNRAALDAIVADWTRQHTSYGAMEILQNAGVPAGPSLNAKELVEDPQLRSRGLFVEADHPEAGRKQGYTLPWQMDPAPALNYKAAPLLGEHNEYVFSKPLGLDLGEIERLRAELVIY